jgi:hypothetical protein
MATWTLGFPICLVNHLKMLLKFLAFAGLASANLISDLTEVTPTRIFKFGCKCVCRPLLAVILPLHF